MNLKYQILWFEDDPKIVEEEIGPKIKEFLEELGFEYICLHRTDSKELEKLDNIGKYDLILTDLNLEDEDGMGEKIIENIRQERILTDVLLYSANADSINRIIEKSGRLIERVSFSVGIGNLKEKIRKLISLTVKKVQDVTNMRGLVIASAIDLEVKMEYIVKRFFKLVGNEEIDNNKKEVLKQMYDNKVNRDNLYLEKIKGLDHTNVESLLEEGFLTASNMYDALMSALNLIDKNFGIQLNGLKDKDKRNDIIGKKDKIKDLRKDLTSFQKDILAIRNTLAHVQEEINDEGICFLKNIKSNGDTIIFNDDKYAEIRLNFNKYTRLIDNVGNFIN